MKLLERIQGDAVELDYDDPYLKLDFPAAQVMSLRAMDPDARVFGSWDFFSRRWPYTPLMIDSSTGHSIAWRKRSRHL